MPLGIAPSRTIQEGGAMRTRIAPYCLLNAWSRPLADVRQFSQTVAHDPEQTLAAPAGIGDRTQDRSVVLWWRAPRTGCRPRRETGIPLVLDVNQRPVDATRNKVHAE